MLAITVELYDADLLKTKFLIQIFCLIFLVFLQVPLCRHTDSQRASYFPRKNIFFNLSLLYCDA